MPLKKMLAQIASTTTLMKVEVGMARASQVPLVAGQVAQVPMPLVMVGMSNCKSFKKRLMKMKKRRK